MAARSQLAPRALSGAPLALLLAWPHLLACLPRDLGRGAGASTSASAAPREDGEDGRRCQRMRRREGREEPAAWPPSTCSSRPFRSPREAVAFVFHEREQRGTSGGRGKDSIPAKFGAGRLGIVGGLPQAWPNVSWHCCPIPRADIETIQTAEFEPI